MDITKLMQEMGQKARQAGRALAGVRPLDKNRALENIAQRLRESGNRLMSENSRDLESGEKNGLSTSMLDRLRLTEGRIEDMAAAVEDIAALPDPVGEVTRIWNRPSGFRVGRMRVPIGVIGIIYESRPNVTIDAAALCMKSGNACILRGGSEAIHSNRALAAALFGANAMWITVCAIRAASKTIANVSRRGLSRPVATMAMTIAPYTGRFSRQLAWARNAR